MLREGRQEKRMAKFKIEWVGSPNFWAGRKGKKIKAIVNHITAGLMPGTLSWMQNPDAQASANYLVTRDGRILQLVKNEDTAWANGVVNKPSWSLYDGTNPNRYTISIEHEGLDGDSLTGEQYQATLWLHRQLIDKYNLPVDNDHIIGHYRIDSVNRPHCPGPQFPWSRLFNDLTYKANSSEAEPWKLQLFEEAVQAGIINQPDQHHPDENAPKWFVIAVALNLLNAIKEQEKT